MPQLAEWARTDAIPSDEEINAVRRLMRANEEQLADLGPAERQRIGTTIATMRKERAVLVNPFPVEFRGLARQARPGLFPSIEAATERRVSDA